MSEVWAVRVYRQPRPPREGSRPLPELELVVLDAGDEVPPGGGVEAQHRAGGVLGVADGDSAGKEGCFDAVAICCTASALEPLEVARIEIHDLDPHLLKADLFPPSLLFYKTNPPHKSLDI